MWTQNRTLYRTVTWPVDAKYSIIQYFDFLGGMEKFVVQIAAEQVAYGGNRSNEFEITLTASNAVTFPNRLLFSHNIHKRKSTK